MDGVEAMNQRLLFKGAHRQSNVISCPRYLVVLTCAWCFKQ
jgi:hypothetical protein